MEGAGRVLEANGRVSKAVREASEVDGGASGGWRDVLRGKETRSTDQSRVHSVNSNSSQSRIIFVQLGKPEIADFKEFWL